MMSYKVY